MSTTLTVEVTLETCCCASCGTTFGIPANMKRVLRETHDSFYCPNGHNNYYPHETEAEKLKKELKRKEQELADTVFKKLRAEGELAAANTKLKRVHHGTCPECKRSFANVKRHMATKHKKVK